MPVEELAQPPLDFWGNPCYHTCMKNQTTAMPQETYNGWANYETWNVALWLQNDYALYKFASRYDDYAKFVSALGFGSETPDGVSFASSKLDYAELNEVMQSL